MGYFRAVQKRLPLTSQRSIPFAAAPEKHANAQRMRLTLTLPSVLLFACGLSAQWAPLSTGMLSNRSLCELQGDLYCATYPNGVKKSVGGTGPFTAVNTGLPLVGGNCFAQSVGTDGTTLYVGTESGIYRSNDGGASWTIANGTLAASPTVFANKFFSFNGAMCRMNSPGRSGFGVVERCGALTDMLMPVHFSSSAPVKRLSHFSP